VREKLQAEEKISFYIMLPPFLAYFIFGLHLSPLSFVWRKGKRPERINPRSWHRRP
jgi:hypothetical protein